MRRSQLIQIAILTIALICFYKLVESLLEVLLALMYQYTDSFSNVWSFIYRYLVVIAVYFIGIIVLIRYNRQLADYIDRQGNPGTNNEETLHLKIEQTNLLFIVLVAVAIITLIQEVPPILMSIFNYFKREAGGFTFGTREDVNFKMSAIRFVFAIIILLTSKSISAWVGRQYHSEKALIETIGEPGETNNLNV